MRWMRLRFLLDDVRRATTTKRTQRLAHLHLFIGRHGELEVHGRFKHQHHRAAQIELTQFKSLRHRKTRHVRRRSGYRPIRGGGGISGVSGGGGGGGGGGSTISSSGTVGSRLGRDLGAPTAWLPRRR